MFEHGGKLIAASRLYSIPSDDWLDLSTGLNPHSWIVPIVPMDSWHHLPDREDELASAACRYYGTNNLLPTAGSQAAIQALPLFWRNAQVGILAPSYNEHHKAWLKHGHSIHLLTPDKISTSINSLDVLIICNPNNPTGHRFSCDTLAAWLAQLQQKNGWLIVDEAFIDPTPDLSMSRLSGTPGLVILRSFGKFFGLAGARVGFVLGDSQFLLELEDHLGPWPVAGPARWVATRALLDRQWQQSAIKQLRDCSRRLANMLNIYHLTASAGTHYFQWIEDERAAHLYEFLAQRGILTRLFKDPASIRFGLPRQEADWERLEQALKEFAQIAQPKVQNLNSAV